MIRPMTDDERKRALEKDKANKERKCVSCGGPAKDDWCSFCLEEE